MKSHEHVTIRQNKSFIFPTFSFYQFKNLMNVNTNLQYWVLENSNPVTSNKKIQSRFGIDSGSAYDLLDMKGECGHVVALSFLCVVI